MGNPHCYLERYKMALSFYYVTLGMPEELARKCTKKELTLDFKSRGHSGY